VEDHREAGGAQGAAMTPWLVALFLLLGALVGFMSGLFGIGGGFTIVPVLTEVFERQGYALEHVLPMAIGTSAATVVFTTFASARAHHARGAVSWPLVRALAPGLVLGSLAGPQIASALPVPVMAAIFGGFTWFTALRMLRSKPAAVTRPLPGKPALFSVATGIGMAAGMVGTGGAFLAVPFMTRCGVKQHTAVATSAALGLPIAAAATLSFVAAGLRKTGLPPYSVGYVFVPGLVAIVVASVLFAPLGARVAHAWSAARLRTAFACMLLVLGAFMWWKALGPALA
jgi:uncharacterized membrane protein YfcA